MLHHDTIFLSRAGGLSVHPTKEACGLMGWSFVIVNGGVERIFEYLLLLLTANKTCITIT
jgi:hypothetical protein